MKKSVLSRKEHLRLFSLMPAVFALLMIYVPVAWSEVIQKAVVITTASDNSSGAHAVVSVDPIGGPGAFRRICFPQNQTLVL